MSAQKKQPGFEKSLNRLEQIVERLDSDELELEESLKLFEEGVALAAELGKRLDQAERKVTLLLKDKQGELLQTPFEPEGEED